MTRLRAIHDPEQLTASLDRVEKGERVLVESGGKAVAALVPLADLAALEALEDAEDVAAAMAALADSDGTVSLAELKARLGL
ncbi:type II toxin-antitoxin system Phd/YefM family antitoxin [bacterium]|nr:type II toxin-antitoxin system Phd/YefM family antitoxin [bacterium]